MGYYKPHKNGGYRLFAEAGRDMNGNRVRKTKVVYPSGPRELKRMLRDFEMEVEDSSDTLSKSMSFKGLVEYWKKNFAETSWASTTYSKNMYVLDEILEYYHPRNIQNIETAHLVEYFTKERAAGRKSLVKKYEIMKSIFKKATEWNFFEVDPMIGVNKPKHRAKKRPFYDEDEIRAALSILDDVQWHQSLIVRLAIFGALRREEILAIGTDVINTKTNSIHIKRALVYTNHKGLELKETKSGEDRTITLPKELLEEMNAYYKHILKIRMELGTANTRPDPNGKKGEVMKTTLTDHEGNEVQLLFTQVNGEVMRPDSVTQFWGRIVDRFELKKISFHDLRHSSASLLISQGINMKVVQERLGHSNIKTTLNIYGHITQKDDELASDVFTRNFTNRAHIGHTLAEKE